MSEEQARVAVLNRLMEKSQDALTAAQRELAAGDTALASNRVYYACFYALSAVLLKQRLQFFKHTGVRAAMHQHLVRTGKLSADLGKFYDKTFAERQEADYNALATFEAQVVALRINDAGRFIAEMRRLLEA